MPVCSINCAPHARCWDDVRPLYYHKGEIVLWIQIRTDHEDGWFILDGVSAGLGRPIYVLRR